MTKCLISLFMLLGSAKAQVNNSDSTWLMMDSASFRFDTTNIGSWLSVSNDTKWYYMINDSSGNQLIEYNDDTLIIYDSSATTIKQIIKSHIKQSKDDQVYQDFLRDKRDLAEKLIEDIRLLYNKNNHISAYKLQKMYDDYYIKTDKRTNEYYDSLNLELTIRK